VAALSAFLMTAAPDAPADGEQQLLGMGADPREQAADLGQ
jgi:hypothetical protein